MSLWHTAESLGVKACDDTCIMPLDPCPQVVPDGTGLGAYLCRERRPRNLQVSRSPARTSVSSRFSGGASGQAQRGSNAHDGW